MKTTDALSFITAVEERMASMMRREQDSGRQGSVLAEAAAHLSLGGGGRRFRPLLVLRMGSEAGLAPAQLEAIAVVAEMIHAASLLHDDVVDEGQERRGRPTANAKFGNLVAVLSGDWLLSTAFRLLSPYPWDVTREAIDTIGEMSRAAIAEVEARGDPDLSLEAWRQIAIGKTGTLFGWCGAAVARAAGREELRAPFEEFGRRLGVAFQLGDDLKDLRGGEGGKASGKDLCADIRNGNPSHPLLVAAKRSHLMRERFQEAWRRRPLEREEALRLGEAVRETGALAESEQALDEEVALALSALGSIATNDWCGELLAAAVGLSAARPEGSDDSSRAGGDEAEALRWVERRG